MKSIRDKILKMIETERKKKHDLEEYDRMRKAIVYKWQRDNTNLNESEITRY